MMKQVDIRINDVQPMFLTDCGRLAKAPNPIPIGFSENFNIANLKNQLRTNVNDINSLLFV